MKSTGNRFGCMEKIFGLRFSSVDSPDGVWPKVLSNVSTSSAQFRAINSTLVKISEEQERETGKRMQKGLTKKKKNQKIKD